MWELDHNEVWVSNWCFWTVMLEKTHESLGRQGDQTSQIQRKSTGLNIQEYSLEGLLLKVKLQYFGHLMRRADSLEKPLCWEKQGRRRGEQAGDERVRQHHWLNGHEFGQTLGANEGQRSLECYSRWSCKESDKTWHLNHNSSKRI